MSRRLVWGVRATFTLGAAASLAANILHANDSVIARVIAAWPPLALLLTVELISRLPVSSRSLSATRLAATALIAGIAAWVSYWHMVEVIRRYGEDTTTAHLLPLSVDGLMVVASICLVEIGHAAREAFPATEVIPEPRKTSLPRGYVKATAREVILNRPHATVPELAAAVVEQTGTHPKHAAQTVKTALQELVPA